MAIARPLREWLLLGIAIAAGILLSPTSLRAESCAEDPLPARCRSYRFTAVVTTVGDPASLFEPLSVGDPISGTFTLDMDVEDADPSNANGYYVDAIKCATVDFPSGRSLEILNDDGAPGEERFIQVENDRVQSLGGGFDLVTDAVLASLGGLGRIVGGSIPEDEWIAGGGVLGFGYSKACIQGFQTPCPPIVVGNDDIPGPPGDVSGLDGAQLHLQFDDFLFSNTAGLFSDLERIDATGVVRCPEPGAAAGLAAGMLGLAVVASTGRRERPSDAIFGDGTRCFMPPRRTDADRCRPS